MLLERLAANLVHNAVRYNATVGWVRVATGLERGEAQLIVENPGALVPADEAAGLLEPFRRLEGSRARTTGGYGLGLAIVRAVAHAHGGRVELVPRAEGGLSSPSRCRRRCAAHAGSAPAGRRRCLTSGRGRLRRI